MHFSRWTTAAVVGAALNGLSATLMRLSEADEATGAVYRCLYALPFLLPLVIWERRRRAGAGRAEPASIDRRSVGLWVLVGLFFAMDLVLWNFSITYVGAGIATVLVNVQVLIVGLVGWFFGEAPSRRLLLMLPVVFVGLVLVSGLIGPGSYGENPALGAVFGVAAAVAYSAYLIFLRRAATRGSAPYTPFFALTAATAGWSALFGMVIGGTNLTPTWPSHGWLLLVALSGQVVGWLLVMLAMPRLPIVVTSFLLLAQPAVAVAFGAVVLGERPSIYQLGGVVLMLAAIVFVGRRPQQATTATGDSGSTEETDETAGTGDAPAHRDGLRVGEEGRR